MGRGTNRHAGLIVAVKLDICETWQIREVASPQAGVQGSERSHQGENVEVGPLADRALSSTTWRLGDRQVARLG